MPSFRSSFEISSLPSKVMAEMLGRSRTTKRRATPSSWRSRSTSMSSKKPEFQSSRTSCVSVSGLNGCPTRSRTYVSTSAAVAQNFDLLQRHAARELGFTRWQRRAPGRLVRQVVDRRSGLLAGRRIARRVRATCSSAGGALCERGRHHEHGQREEENEARPGLAASGKVTLHLTGRIVPSGACQSVLPGFGSAPRSADPGLSQAGSEKARQNRLNSSSRAKILRQRVGRTAKNTAPFRLLAGLFHYRVARV